MRQFTLENSQGDVFDLNGNEFFVYDPEGLGVQLSNSYSSNGTNFQIVNQALQQNKLTFSILFGAPEETNSYLRYSDFIEFLDWPPLKLHYSMPDMGTFTRDVAFSGLTKSEINKFGVIDEKLTLDCLTPWYTWVEGDLTRYADQEGDGYIFENEDMAKNMGFHIYPYVFQESDDGGVPVQVNIENRSRTMGLSEGAAFELEIKCKSGIISNPYWYIGNQSDGYFVDIVPGETLHVSSDPTREFAQIERVDGQVTNIYKHQDFMRTNFVRVPKGTSQFSLFATLNNVPKSQLPEIAINADVKFRIKRELITI